MVTEFSFLHYDDKELFATLATGRGKCIAYKLYNKVFVARFQIISWKDGLAIILSWILASYKNTDYV